MQVEMLNKDGSVLLPEGNDLLAAPSPPAASPARAREGETHKEGWERLRREARAAGMNKQAAYDYATREADRLFPSGQSTDQVASGAVLAGLGDLPAEWPPLPANAALAVEVAWVRRTGCASSMVAPSISVVPWDLLPPMLPSRGWRRACCSLRSGLM